MSSKIELHDQNVHTMQLIFELALLVITDSLFWINNAKTNPHFNSRLVYDAN